MSPHASVIIPVYNVAACIERAIASVLAQTMQDFEILVVDDGSTDDTVAIVARLAAQDARIRLIRQQRNAGPSAARNRALVEAKGAWIAMLDADDAFRPARLEKLIQAAERGGIDMIADNLVYFDQGAGREAGLARFNKTRQVMRLDLLTHLRTSNFRPGFVHIMGRIPVQSALLKFIFSRAFLRRHAILYPEAIRNGEDYYMYAECLIRGAKAAVIPDALYVYTQSFGTVSYQKSTLSRTQAQLAQVLAAAETLDKNLGNAMPPAARAQLAVRQNALRGLHAYDTARQQAREGRMAAALFGILTAPHSWRFVVREIVTFLRRRIKHMLTSRNRAPAEAQG